MLRPPRSGPLRTLALGWLAACCPSAVLGDDPPAPHPALDVKASTDAMKAIKPLPVAAIPDDPPPHEGALIDIPLTIEPPDIIIVEVLEALPGRPISGERLVRPDGTVSLGFYGDVQVRGLTPAQAKVKVVHRLRLYLSDDVLGLRAIIHEGSKLEPLPAPGTTVRVEMVVPQDERPFEKPDVERPGVPAAPQANSVIPAPSPPTAELPRSMRTFRRARSDRREKRLAASGRVVKTRLAAQQKPDGPVAPPVEPQPKLEQTEMVYIDPADTVRVFVDLASYNSKVYYVQGDVGTPGRLPITGKETVIDALTYAGGLIPTSEPTDIHLYRPARGDKPARDYSIDFEAIRRGEKKANLQLFPDDRLVVGRNALVKKTIEIDRAMAPVSSVLNSSVLHSMALRTLGLAAGDINGTPQAVRDQSFRRWFDLLWNLPGGKAENLDPGKLLEAVPMKVEPNPPIPPR